jgi:predicted DNA binding CopG/RHH family protein
VPTKQNRVEVLFNDDELEVIKARAKAKGLSLSNYFRKREKMKPLLHGAKKKARKK